MNAQLSWDILAKTPGRPPVVHVALLDDEWRVVHVDARMRSADKNNLAHWVQEELELRYRSDGIPEPYWREGATMRKHVALSFAI
jgi:hypothetical protein